MTSPLHCRLPEPSTAAIFVIEEPDIHLLKHHIYCTPAFCRGHFSKLQTFWESNSVLSNTAQPHIELLCGCEEDAEDRRLPQAVRKILFAQDTYLAEAASNLSTFRTPDAQDALLASRECMLKPAG